MIKKTKIVATIGPATENKISMEELALAGMDVVRLNFSHGNYKEHLNRINLARLVSKKINKPIAILQDLSGPKIRIGDFYSESIILRKGQTFILTASKCVGDEKKVFINYPNIPKEIKYVEKILGNEIRCKIIIGGEIKGRRGVNFPDSNLRISSLTKKDREDIKFGIKNKVDFMAISFVRKPSDILELRNILNKAKANIKIIAKIETKEAIENLDEIIKSADGVMVARGDLAVEMLAEHVPILQKNIIKKCNYAGKPVITATQMLDSMIKNPVPTRAEVNDVANAILDGTDAVMLSEETALGNYPIEAVSVMARIARHTEENYNHEEILKHAHLLPKSINDSISYGIVTAAHNIRAEAIIALTEYGNAARMISRYKPKQPIIALTPNRKTYNQLSLSFGCQPMLIKYFKEISEVVKDAKKIAVKNKIAKIEEKVLI